MQLPLLTKINPALHTTPGTCEVTGVLPIWQPGGLRGLEVWLVCMELCCTRKIPTLNFKDLVEVEYFINNFYINYMLEL